MTEAGPPITVRVATLRPDRVEAYERLHRELPARAIELMREDGFDLLDIHRVGLTLIMLLRAPPGPLAARTPEDVGFETRQQMLTDECFASPWRDSLPMFTLTTK